MAQITVTFESYEDLKEFAEKLLGTKQETKRETAVQCTAAENKVAEKVVTPVQAVPTFQVAQVAPTAAPAQAIPVQQPAPVSPVQTPVTAVPTTERTYTLDELANAAMTLMDKGMQTQLQELLAGYGVEALPALPKDQYGNFATALRGMGANI